MDDQHAEMPIDKLRALAQWEVMLQDQAALLKKPGAHHKALLQQAYALHQAQVIDRDGLSDLLEQADGALAYAVESLIDRQFGDHSRER